MLVRRGADAAREDKSSCQPVFLAEKVRAFECQQIIKQHLLERTERLATEANNVSTLLIFIISFVVLGLIVILMVWIQHTNSFLVVYDTRFLVTCRNSSSSRTHINE